LPEKRVGARQPAATRAIEPPGTLNEARWAEVLNAAAELFAEKGYAKTTVQDVASRAGFVNKGSLYYYINTKEDLLWQLALQVHTDVLERFKEDEPTLGADPPTRLESFIGWWTRYIIETTPRFGWVGREIRSLSPDRAVTLAKLRRQFRSIIIRILRDGVEDGSFDPDLDTNIVLHSIVSLVQATTDWYHAPGRGSLDDVIAWYQRSILRGLAR
jgi:TetR/AcrR family transcriptional regulator, cholesterol catabolism regulator